MKDTCKVCLQSLVGFDPSIVFVKLVGFWSVLLSQSVGSPFVGFVSVMDKSFVRRPFVSLPIC